MSHAAIRTEGLVKDYGQVRALAGVDLEVQPGEVYGFLGPNGAGKTTTIRVLLDLLRPTAGNVRVLGLDPRADSLTMRRRIGYLGGDFLVEGRQSGRELLTYLANLRGGVATGRIEALAQRLQLDLDTEIRSLSRGNRQKVGLVQAFMHEPELLILDEPTSGLDPLLQHEFVAMAHEATAAGTAVFMSSHIMSEVQQTADRVGVIRNGRVVAVEQVETLRDRAVRHVEIRFDRPPAPDVLDRVPGVTDSQLDDDLLRCRLTGRADPLIKALARHTVITLSVEEPDLEELFFAYYARDETDDAP